MVISSIMAAPTPKHAVSYDPEAKCLVYEKAEIIGIVHLQDPEDPDEVQMVPSYLVSNRYGFFWVPELEYNFLAYIELEKTLSMTSEWAKKRIAEIEKEAIEAINNQPETVEVETSGNVAKIRRIKFVKKDEDDEK